VPDLDKIFRLRALHGQGLHLKHSVRCFCAVDNRAKNKQFTTLDTFHPFWLSRHLNY